MKESLKIVIQALTNNTVDIATEYQGHTDKHVINISDVLEAVLGLLAEHDDVNITYGRSFGIDLHSVFVEEKIPSNIGYITLLKLMHYFNTSTVNLKVELIEDLNIEVKPINVEDIVHLAFIYTVGHSVTIGICASDLTEEEALTDKEAVINTIAKYLGIFQDNNRGHIKYVTHDTSTDGVSRLNTVVCSFKYLGTHFRVLTPEELEALDNYSVN